MKERLYVLLDQKLSPGQKLSQSGHAIAEYLLRGPREWDNHTIVILDAPKFMVKQAIQEGATGFQDSYFSEPRAAAFTHIPAMESDIKLLPLAK